MVHLPYFKFGILPFIMNIIGLITNLNCNDRVHEFRLDLIDLSNERVYIKCLNTLWIPRSKAC